MRGQQHRKNYQGRIRSAGGQTTLQSFLFKSRVVDGDVKPPATPEAGEEVQAPVCPREPPKREIVRVTKATIKEKASAFSSVGSSSGKNECGGALSAAVFKGFHSSAPVPSALHSVTGDGEKAAEDGDGGGGVRFDMGDAETRNGREPWRKRKSPTGDCHEEQGSSAKAMRVVVLGDDPRPRPRRMPGRHRPTRGGGSQDEGGRALYNHYASGGGWWHGDMEGVDGEEIGWTDDMWEGMGSVTLGGLEWH